MTALSKASIANQALTHLGADRIISLTEDSEQARKVSAIWDQTRDFVLAEHPWGFATARASLGQLVETPVFGFDVYYQVPTKCLRIFEVSPSDAKWAVEGDKIASNTTPLYALYVQVIEDVTKWSPGFVYAFQGKLAADLAYAIANSRSLGADLLEAYEKIYLPKAVAMDSQEQSPQAFEDGSWITERW